jgi:glycosyltransferase involved in cell wall biosynthesis
MSKRTLSGFRKAAKIICPSASTRENILTFGLVDPERVSVVANGAHPDFSIKPDGAADRKAEELLGPPRKSDLLHVGTTIPRKRVDTLLEVLALTRSKFPEARLIQAGGNLTQDQKALAIRLNVHNAILVLPHLERSVLASVYRRSAALLLPSEREGFGLPVVEAMACGTPVMASDIAALREVGGTAAWYCAVGDTRTWSASASLLLHECANDAEARSRRSAQCVERASRFSWTEYAKSMAAIYRDLFESRQ